MIGHDTLARIRRERERAEGLLRHLLEAKAESERNLAAANERDPMKTATGRSAFDNAILATRKMIDTLDRTCAEAQRPAQAPTREPRIGALVGTLA
jgi:hypothetical protein